MCGMEWDSERKRQENWHKWRRGDRKERKHESTGECTEMKKKRRTTASGKRQTRHILSPNKTLYLFLYFILLTKC